MKLWPWLLGAICLVFLVSSLEEIGVFMAEKGFKHAAKLLRAPSTRGNAPESEVETSGNPFGPRFRKDKDGRYQILPYKLKENDFDLQLVASKNTCATRPLSQCLVPGRLITSWEVLSGVIRMEEDKNSRNTRRFLYKKPRDPKIYIKNCKNVEFSSSKTTGFEKLVGKSYINVGWKEDHGLNFVYAKCLDNPHVVEERNHLIYPTPIEQELASKTNVVVLQIDALSSRQFKEQYVETQTALKEMEEAQVFSFENYWVNGLNSEPNMHRMYCQDKDCDDHHVLKYFQLAGFVTSWVEEYTYGLMGHPLKNKGVEFVDKLYAGNYYNKHWKNDLSDMPNMWAWDEYIYVKSLRFLDLFLRDGGPTGEQGSHAAIVIPNIAHSTERMRGKQMDSELAKFFKQWSKSGIMDNTIFVMVADHGIHGSPVNVFLAGEYEHRNPVFEMVVPNAFLRKYPKAQDVLEHNTKAILSHFDFYDSIGALATPEEWEWTDRTNPTKRRSYNIFVDKIPQERNCNDAKIPKEWCNCWIEKGEKC